MSGVSKLELVVGLTVCLVVFAGCANAQKPAEPGVVLRFEAVEPGVTPSQLGQAAQAVKSRLAGRAYKVRRVAPEGERSVVVEVARSALELPGVAQHVVQACERRGMLEFRILAKPAENQWRKYRGRLQAQGPAMASDEAYTWLLVDNPAGLFGLNNPTELDEMNVTQSREFVAERVDGQVYVLAAGDPDSRLLVTDPPKRKIEAAWTKRDTHGRWTVHFRLDVASGDALYDLTRRHLGEEMAIVVDGRVLTAPRIVAEVRQEVQIVGDFSAAEARQLTRMLGSEPLPIQLRFAERRTPIASAQAD